MVYHPVPTDTLRAQLPLILYQVTTISVETVVEDDRVDSKMRARLAEDTPCSSQFQNATNERSTQSNSQLSLKSFSDRDDSIPDLLTHPEEDYLNDGSRAPHVVYHFKR